MPAVALLVSRPRPLRSALLVAALLVTAGERTAAPCGVATCELLPTGEAGEDHSSPVGGAGAAAPTGEIAASIAETGCSVAGLRPALTPPTLPVGVRRELEGTTPISASPSFVAPPSATGVVRCGRREPPVVGVDRCGVRRLADRGVWRGDTRSPPPVDESPPDATLEPPVRARLVLRAEPCCDGVLRLCLDATCNDITVVSGARVHQHQHHQHHKHHHMPNRSSRAHIW